MLETLRQMLSYPFMQRALVVGLLVSLCAALLGSSLVLKRYSMIGDGLSHVGFGAIAVAMACGLAPLAVAIPVVAVAAVVLMHLGERSRIKGDAGIAIISTSALAIGVIVISQSTGITTDVYSYMFGSILAMSGSDVAISVALSIVVLVMYIFSYNRIFLITFDETFAEATGVRTRVCNLVLAVATAVTVVLGMRMMGTLLITSFIIFPPLSAMRVCKTYRAVVISSAVISVVCFFAGMIISYFCATPTGASIVVVDLAAFLIFAAVGAVKNRTRGERA